MGWGGIVLFLLLFLAFSYFSSVNAFDQLYLKPFKGPILVFCMKFTAKSQQCFFSKHARFQCIDKFSIELLTFR